MQFHHLVSRFATSAWACALLSTAACGDDGGDAAPDANLADAAPQAVTLNFAAEIGGTAFACGGSYPSLGTASSTYVASDFRIYVHGVELLTTDAVPVAVPLTLDVDAFQNADGIALLDFENAAAGCDDGTVATHTAITGTVPPGHTFGGVRFKLGVPESANYLNANVAQAPLNVIPMWWAWQLGYKFTKIDGAVGGNGFFLHVGAIGCPGSDFEAPPTAPCTHPNQVTYELTGFTPATSTIVADIAPVFATVDLTTNTANTAPGCMSETNDAECAAIFPRLGLPLDTTPAGTQQLFSVR